MHAEPVRLSGSPFHGLAPADLLCPGIPKRYATAQLSALDGASAEQRLALDSALATVRRVIEGRPASLVLLGSPGVGKSHLSAGICNAVVAWQAGTWRLDKNRRNIEHAMGVGTDRRLAPESSYGPLARGFPQWVNVPSLMVDVKAEFGAEPSDQTWTQYARSLRSTRSLVVLDDLGRERISEWTGELLYVIVNDRYEAGLPTVATSNLTIEELVASGYWPAISRLAEDGRLVEIKAPDQRLRRTA